MTRPAAAEAQGLGRVPVGKVQPFYQSRVAPNLNSRPFMIATTCG